MICIAIHAEEIPAPISTAAAASGCQAFSGPYLRRLPSAMPQHFFEIAVNPAVAESDFAGNGIQNLGTANFSQLLGTTRSIGVSQYFEPATIWVGENSVLKIDLVNFFANPIDAGSLSLTDMLPSGVTVTGAASDVDGCGISTTAALGSGSIVLSGGSIPAGGACEIDVPVTSAMPSATPYVNTIARGAMTAKIEGVTASNGGPATAPLQVYAPITATKTVTSSDNKVCGASKMFTFTARGCSLPLSSFGASVTMTSANALSGSTTIRGLVPDNCTISQIAPKNTPTNYTWNAPAEQTMTTTAVGATAASLTNLLNANAATLAVTENITGDAASVIASSLRFPYLVTRATPTSTYVGDVTAGAGGLLGSDNL